MARNTLSINGTDISTYGIYISSDTYLDAPKIDYAEYQIPAKNGTAILDKKRLNNVIRKFDCYIPEGQNIDTAMGNLKRLLYLNKGYIKLISSYDSSWYQYGYLAQEINVTPFKKNGSAEFSLYFSCMPEHYENSQITYQSTNSIGTSTYASSFKLNGDSKLVEFIANLDFDYPYSPIGWIYNGVISTTGLSEGTTYTVNISSTNTQKYVILLHGFGTPVNEAIKLLEVDNYAVNQFTFTVPTLGYTAWNFRFAAPVLFNDINISITGDVTGSANNVMTDVTSTYFTNLTAFGIKPIFVYKKTIYPSNISNGVSCIDLFSFNDAKYVVDFISMANDMTNQFIYDNYVISDKVYVYLDFINKKAYLLDSLDVDGEKLADISAYFKCYSESLMGNSFDVKYGAMHETTGGTTPIFMMFGIDGKVTFQTNWWRL